MSADATGWTYRCSPVRGATFQVHLAIADSVNDLHRNEFWMSVSNLAIKARVSERMAREALHELVALGLLRMLQAPRHRPRRYVFCFADLPAVYESRYAASADLDVDRGMQPVPTRPAEAADPGMQPVPLGLQPVPPNPIEPKETTQEEPNRGAPQNGDAKSKRATSFPEQFFITPTMRAWATEKAQGVDVQAETEQFCDYHRAKGDRAKDWTASWRTWMRNALKFQRRGGPTTRGEARFATTVASLATLNPQGELNGHTTGAGDAAGAQRELPGGALGRPGRAVERPTRQS